MRNPRQSPAGERQALFRAVRPAELEEIARTCAVRNPEGIEVKYFSTTLEGARKYAELAEGAYADGPYALVATALPKSEITSTMVVTVDVDILTVAVPTDKLKDLSEPVVRGRRGEGEA